MGCSMGCLHTQSIHFFSKFLSPLIPRLLMHLLACGQGYAVGRQWLCPGLMAPSSMCLLKWDCLLDFVPTALA